MTGRSVRRATEKRHYVMLHLQGAKDELQKAYIIVRKPLSEKSKVEFESRIKVIGAKFDDLQILINELLKIEV